MSPIQRKVLDAIRDLTERDVAPTFRQLAEAVGLASRGRAYRIVDELIELGLVEKAAGVGRHRNLRVVADQPAYTLKELSALTAAQLDQLIADASVARARKTGAPA